MEVLPFGEISFLPSISVFWSHVEWWSIESRVETKVVQLDQKKAKVTISSLMEDSLFTDKEI